MDGARGSGAQKVTYTFVRWFRSTSRAEGRYVISLLNQQVYVGLVMSIGIAGDQFGIRSRKLKSLTM